MNRILKEDEQPRTIFKGVRSVVQFSPEKIPERVKLAKIGILEKSNTEVLSTIQVLFILKKILQVLLDLLPNPQKIMYNLKVANMAQRIGHPSPPVPPPKK